MLTILHGGGARFSYPLCLPRAHTSVAAMATVEAMTQCIICFLIELVFLWILFLLIGFCFFFDWILFLFKGSSLFFDWIFSFLLDLLFFLGLDDFFGLDDFLGDWIFF